MTLRPLTCHFQYNNRFVTVTPKVYGEILYTFEQNKKLDGSPYWLYIKDQKTALNFYIETSMLAIKNATLLNSKLPIFARFSFSFFFRSQVAKVNIYPSRPFASPHVPSGPSRLLFVAVPLMGHYLSRTVSL